MTIRQQQVESELQRVISTVLQRKLSDPRLAGMISVTEVKVSPDLRQANVFVSVLPQEHERRAIEALQHAGGHIQRLVRSAVAIRSVPALEFRLDERLKKQAAVFSAIREGIEREENQQ
ncbi:MAG: ribosome-binding factor A [Phycisphaeraceae bacterium]|nr:ribosome-binding factor A [Phycisphaeraceae bacterium]